jgi:flagellar hook assembly protein FlgD
LLELENDFNQVSVGFTLKQNYSNPFLSEAKSRLVADAAPRGAGSPETEIRFALPQASHAVVKIYNLLGEEVRTLVDEQLETGYHAVRWGGKDKNGKFVASGIYLYQLQAGTFREVKKMSLLR